MATELAMKHARDLLRFANTAPDDPRRTRIDLLQVGNYIASHSRSSPELRALLRYIRDFNRSQLIKQEDWDDARANGWPVIKSVPGPISYFYAAARLGAHAALRNPQLIQTFEDRIRDVEGLTQKVHQVLEATEDDLYSAIMVVASETAADQQDFRSRLVAAAKDIHQTVTSDEFPRSAHFLREPFPARPTWPPLRLGYPPISGGAWDENPDDDWGDGEDGGDGEQTTICTSGSIADDIMCGVIVVVVIVVIIVVSTK